MRIRLRRSYITTIDVYFLRLEKYKKGTSLSRCLLLAEMVGILPRAKQQPAGLIACGLRTAALFSSSPSWPQKRHRPEPVPFVGGDGGIRTHVPG